MHCGFPCLKVVARLISLHFLALGSISLLIPGVDETEQKPVRNVSKPSCRRGSQQRCVNRITNHDVCVHFLAPTYVLQMLLRREGNELELEEEKQTAQGVKRGEFIELVHHIDDMATNLTVMRQFVTTLEEATNQLLVCAWKVRRLSGYV